MLDDTQSKILFCALYGKIYSDKKYVCYCKTVKFLTLYTKSCEETLICLSRENTDR